MTKISCIVVTFNKVDLLRENLEALLNQSVKIEHIIIVDNASTDHTQEFVMALQKKHSEIDYFKLTKNVGGAGGFNFGMKEAYRTDTDFVWVMDDDTIPAHDALEELLQVAERQDLDWGFLSSDVRWIDGSPCYMNIPRPDKVWPEKIDEGLVRILSGTFVSLFIRRETIKTVGLPIKEFFLWSDDIEFTQRISEKSPCYFVPKSKILHKMGANTDTNIFEEDDKNRIPRYFFSFRNKLFLERKKSLVSFFRYLLSLNISIFSILLRNTNYKWEKIKVTYKGIFAGLMFNPKIEQVEE